MERKINMTLLELLEVNDHYHSKSGNDIGTDKEWRHLYISTFYEEEFKRYKDKEVSLLEIGTGHGGSLIMWNDYFEKGSIYGVDVNDYTDPIIKTYPRIHTSIDNAYSKKFVEDLPGFDIIIDDGPHTFDSHIKTLELYISKVKKGGMLIIEDIPDIKYTERYVEMTQDYVTRVIDTREQSGLHDNIMFILWK